MISTDYREFDPDTRVSKLKGYFDETNSKAAVIVDSDYEGVVTQRELISSHLNPKEKASSVMVNPPKVGRREDVREVSRLMVEGNSKVLPVMEGENLYGVVTADSLLDAVNSNLSVLDVDDVFTQDLVSVGSGTTVGEIINVLRENGISRVPVIDGGDLVGIVTIYDILDFTVRKERKNKGGGLSDSEHGGHGSREGELQRMLDIQARDVMNSPVETVTPDASLDKAVDTMMENDYSSLIVVEDSSPVGVITKTDVLRSLTWTEEEHMDVQIANIDLLDTTSREDVVTMIEDVSDKYADMQVLHAHLHLQKHKEKLRGNPLILARIILYTNEGQFVGTGEGYGAKHALRLATDNLERQVLSAKGVKRSDRDAERLLKELGI